MKIYTRTGDAGDTGLFGGGRVSKAHERIHAYGTVDEANSFVGAARSFLADVEDVALLDEMLELVQRSLFTLGADLATPSESRANVDRISKEHVGSLEKAIDRLELDLEPLKHFILPGGSKAGAMLHIARTVCRRAERMVAAMQEADDHNRTTLVYLNRLSDFFFVAARWANSRARIEEATWAGSSD